MNFSNRRLKIKSETLEQVLKEVEDLKLDLCRRIEGNKHPCNFCTPCEMINELKAKIEAMK